MIHTTTNTLKCTVRISCTQPHSVLGLQRKGTFQVSQDNTSASPNMEVLDQYLLNTHLLIPVLMPVHKHLGGFAV